MGNQRFVGLIKIEVGFYKNVTAKTTYNKRKNIILEEFYDVC